MHLTKSNAACAHTTTCTQLEDLRETYQAEIQRRTEGEAAARSAAHMCRVQLEEQRKRVEHLQVGCPLFVCVCVCVREYVCVCARECECVSATVHACINV